MVCQHLDFAPLPVILITQFVSYWGHAARVTVPWSPIVTSIALRSAGWRRLHPDVKQAKGIRLDTCQKLQEWWLQFRPPGSPIFWYGGAQDRSLWKDLVPWLVSLFAYPQGQWFPDLHEVDLHHRQLLVVDSTYHLLQRAIFQLKSYMTVPCMWCAPVMHMIACLDG